MPQTESEVKEVIRAAVRRGVGVRALQLLRTMVDECQREEQQNAVAARWVSFALLLAIGVLVAWATFHFGTSTPAYRPVGEVPVIQSYIESAAKHIEQTAGTRYRNAFPTHEATGSVLLHVVVKGDGQVEEVGVLKASGISALDKAFVGLIWAASPLPQLPAELRETTDVLELTTSLSVSEDGAVVVSR